MKPISETSKNGCTVAQDNQDICLHPRYRCDYVCRLALFMAWLASLPAIGFVLRIITVPFMALGPRMYSDNGRICRDVAEKLGCRNSYDCFFGLSPTIKIDTKNSRKNWPSRIIHEPLGKARNINEGADMPITIIEPNSAIGSSFIIPKDRCKTSFTIKASGLINYFVMDINQYERLKARKYPLHYYFGLFDITKSEQEWVFDNRGEYVLFVENEGNSEINVEYHFYME